MERRRSLALVGPESPRLGLADPHTQAPRNRTSVPIPGPDPALDIVAGRTSGRTETTGTPFRSHDPFRNEPSKPQSSGKSDGISAPIPRRVSA